MKYWTVHIFKINWTLTGKYDTLGIRLTKTMTKDISMIVSILMIQLGNTCTLYYI